LNLVLVGLNIAAYAGSLPKGLSQQEFFEGYSVPRNQEIMRIFKDLGPNFCNRG